LKVRGDEQSVTNSGKLFHARGPATAKALSPSDERRVAGTTRADDDADRSRRRDVTSVTGRMTSCRYRGAAPCHEDSHVLTPMQLTGSSIAL